MRVELTEVHWLDRQHELSLAELCELAGLSPQELQELVDYGALAPIDPAAAVARFRTDCIALARTAVRLRHDFELDASSVALALCLLDRIHDLESQLRTLHAQLPRIR